MPKFLIKLTPLEPYFFGGEHIFEIGGNNKQYFIRSLDTPSQTTLFGALRYIGINNPSKNFHLKEEDKKNIGDFGFKIDDKSINDFGKIECISPLYITDQEDNFLIRTPFDHKIKGEEQESDGERKPNKIYSPFKKYCGPVHTVDDGKRFFPMDYTAKDGLANSWMSIRERAIYDDLFRGHEKIGINKKQKENGFFKREYKTLKQGFSFAFFAETKDGFEPQNEILYLGQGKSLFKADWDTENSEILGKIAIPDDLIGEKMVYAQSDLYVPENIHVLYNDCEFVCVKTRDFSVFTTDYRRATIVTDRFQKGKNIKLIQAGSMFRTNNVSGFKEKIQNSHVEIAGFNKIIGGKVK